MKTVTVTIDDSQKLQKLINSIGNTPAKYIFDTPDIEINSLIRVYNNTEWDGQGCKFTLMENAPLKPFGLQIPLIAPKNPSSAEKLTFKNLKFEGNRDYQKFVPGWNGHSGKEASKQWGQGYHNFFMLGSLGSVKYTNSSKCSFENIDFRNNLGDGIRIEGGQDITIKRITGSRGGHDVVCVAGARNVDVSELDIDTEVNAAVRFRSVINGRIHNCKLRGTKGNTGPLIQVQNTAENWNCQDIEVFENSLSDSFGPAMWVIGTAGQNNINIHNNLSVNCGLEPAAIKTDDVGGICIDGFDANIENNTFDKCMGYGIVFSGWQTSSILVGLKSTVTRNIVTNTKESNYKGTASGSAIANLTGNRNTVVCSENCYHGNTNNNYAVTVQSEYNIDPWYKGNGDYHLQDNSPCRYHGLGCFTDTMDNETKVLISCFERHLPELTKALTTDYKIYRR